MTTFVSEQRQAQRESDARIRHQATSDFRRLEADIERLTEELGRHVVLLWKGEGAEESVHEVEAELDVAERDLRRAQAAYSYVR
jgi:hypothetical protein